jgi:hypothetical protein
MFRSFSGNGPIRVCAQFCSIASRVAEVRSGTEVRTSNRWTGPAGSGTGSPRRMVFKNRFEP